MDLAEKLSSIINRVAAGELALDAAQARSAVWDVLADPDEWDGLADVLARLWPLRGPARHAQGVVRFEVPSVVAGDLIVDGDVECLSHTLVLGKLEVTGYVYSGIHDCVIVAGDLTARAIDVLRSYWWIRGAIQTETAWLSTYGFLAGASALRARLLVVQQSFDVRDEVAVEAGCRVDTDYLPKDAAAKATLAELLDLDVLRDDKGELDSWKLLRRVARGEPVFRAAGAGPVAQRKPATTAKRKPATTAKRKPATTAKRKPATTAKRKPRVKPARAAAPARPKRPAAQSRRRRRSARP